jgi:hypothetical protein
MTQRAGALGHRPLNNAAWKSITVWPFPGVAKGYHMIRAEALIFSLLILGKVAGCSCRNEIRKAEIEQLRQGMRAEMDQQSAAQDDREQEWVRLRAEFDKDKDGKLSNREEAAMNARLNKIKSGEVPNPFAK